MTITDVTQKLKALVSEDIKNGWTPEITHGDETYGLNFTRIKSVAKEISNDPILADELYASNNHDMKVLATFIDDPEGYTQDELEMRAEQLYPSPFAEKFCQQVIAHSPHAVHFVNKWINSTQDDERSYAYHTLAELAKQKNNLSNEFYRRQVEEIGDRINEESEVVREAMLSALLSIGCRDRMLKEKTMQVASSIGQVELGEGITINPLERLEQKAQIRKPVNL
jgi:hypothetical protein